MNEEDFAPEQLVDMATEMAERQIDEMNYAEKVACIRDVVAAFSKAGILTADPEGPDQSVEAAMQTLYICKLIPAIFPSAYNMASVEVDIKNRKDSVIDALNRSFNL